MHNIIKYIMRSDQRRQEFAQWTQELAKDDDELFKHCFLILIKDGGSKFQLLRILKLAKSHAYINLYRLGF